MNESWYQPNSHEIGDYEHHSHIFFQKTYSKPPEPYISKKKNSGKMYPKKSNTHNTNQQQQQDRHIDGMCLTGGQETTGTSFKSGQPSFSLASR